MNEAILVVTAARPTSAWKAATVCGSSVTATFCPIYLPATPAIPRRESA